MLTEAPTGPLYRVVGSTLFISCNVSGLASESLQKEFEFRIKIPAKPDTEINIISTSDQYFGYAMYASRVRSKEINVKRVSPNSVLFEITSLQKKDEGEYECTVINSESVYVGTYSAKTTVKGNKSQLYFYYYSVKAIPCVVSWFECVTIMYLSLFLSWCHSD